MKIPNMEHGQFVDKDGNLTETWRAVLTQLFDELQNNVSDEGLVLSTQSTANITTIANGQTTPAIWYDSDTNQPKINVNGIVRVLQTGGNDFNETITLTPLSAVPGSPQEGMMYVDNTAGNHLYIYLNSSWNLII